MKTKVLAFIAVGIAVIVGIAVSVGFTGDSQNDEKNEIVLEESIGIVEGESEENTEEVPAGKQFTIELKESLSIKGE